MTDLNIAKVVGTTINYEWDIDPTTKDLKLQTGELNIAKKLQNRLTVTFEWFFWNQTYGSVLAGMGDFRWPIDVAIVTRLIVGTINEEPAIKNIVSESIKIWYDNSQTELFYSMDLILNSYNNEIISFQGQTNLYTKTPSNTLSTTTTCL